MKSDFDIIHDLSENVMKQIGFKYLNSINPSICQEITACKNIKELKKYLKFYRNEARHAGLRHGYRDLQAREIFFIGDFISYLIATRQRSKCANPWGFSFYLWLIHGKLFIRDLKKSLKGEK